MHDAPDAGRPRTAHRPKQPTDARGASSTGAPQWLQSLIRRTIWRLTWVAVAFAGLALAVVKARGLLAMLVVALFFAIAMEPAVTYLHARFGWRRGAATGVIFVVVAGSFIVLVAVLIPGVVEAAGRIGAKLPGWLDTMERRIGVSLAGGEAGARAGADLEAAMARWLTDNARDVLGLATTSVGLLFQLVTIAMFTFYLTADAPRIRRTVLTRMPPDTQQRVGWAWDTAIRQTGGYFYSRLLLMSINGGLFFVVMLVVGMPWLIALPLAIFEGFVAAFVPAVGTYLGAAVPIIVTFGIQGLWPALILLGWTAVYQLAENYWLSPRISARTMELNGGIAFGAALAGGAVAGPMGAFMALPVAALIASFLTHYARRYPLAYHSVYDRGPAGAAAAEARGGPGVISPATDEATGRQYPDHVAGHARFPRPDPP